jgi:hypothetical protein
VIASILHASVYWSCAIRAAQSRCHYITRYGLLSHSISLTLWSSFIQYTLDMVTTMPPDDSVLHATTDISTWQQRLGACICMYVYVQKPIHMRTRYDRLRMWNYTVLHNSTAVIRGWMNSAGQLYKLIALVYWVNTNNVGQCQSLSIERIPYELRKSYDILCPWVLDGYHLIWWGIRTHSVVAFCTDTIWFEKVLGTHSVVAYWTDTIWVKKSLVQGQSWGVGTTLTIS